MNKDTDFLPERVNDLCADAGSLPALAPYDAGLLSDFGGGNVEWWQDYIRAELGRAHDFYVDQFDAVADSAREQFAAAKHNADACADLRGKNDRLRQAVDGYRQVASQDQHRADTADAWVKVLEGSLQKMRATLKALQPALNVMAREVLDDIIREQIDPVLFFVGGEAVHGQVVQPIRDEQP